MKYYMLAVGNDGEFQDIRKIDDEEFIIDRKRYEELTRIEMRYKEHLQELIHHTMVDDVRLRNLLKIEDEYKELIRQIKVDEFKPHYQADPIKYAVHILKGYLRAYLKKHTTKCTGIVEKRMLVVSFCHRIEEGLIDYLDELEEFNS